MKWICQAIWCESEKDLSITQIDRIQRFINNLPEDQQRILYMHYSMEVPVREISRQLKLSSTTTYNKLHRALFALRNEFNPSFYDGMYRILYPETRRPTRIK